MSTYKTFNKRVTNQTEKAKPNQVQNNAGGYTFEVSDQQRLRRFLILGSDANTFYQRASDLTKENGEFIIKMAQSNPSLLVDQIKDVYESGAAAKQDPTLFALAIAVAYIDKKTSAYSEALRMVSDLRTATQLFTFIDYAQQFRGWGRSFREAVADWYLGRDADNLAYQMVKYRNRNGWTHRDVLRKAHPKTSDTATNSLFKWTTSKEYPESLPSIVKSYQKANEEGADVAAMVREDSRLSWEMLPTDSLKDPSVWEALVENDMPMTALIRNLSRLSKLGLTSGMGGLTDKIVDQISNQRALNKARIHPMQILFALRAYSLGHSKRVESAWAVSGRIEDALDDAFYASFGSFEPANKRTLIGLDVSQSMDIAIDPNNPITAKDASVALSMVQLATEKDSMVLAFTSGSFWDDSHLVELNLSPRKSLQENVRIASKVPFGGTDCALPMLYALEKEIEVDTFIVYTDNETWAGKIHPHQALQQYRNKMGIPAKLVVVGMTSTGFSIADPDDSGMLDVVGFDASTPKIINDFSAGRI